MVSISSQEVKVNIGEIKWYNQEYSGALPNNFEAAVIIMINGKTCFDEPGTSVGELLIQLREWEQTTRDGQMKPFYHHSIDFEGNILISVTHDLSKNSWILDLHCPKCQPYPLKEEAAIILIRRLYQILEQAMLEKFGKIKIAW